MSQVIKEFLKKNREERLNIHVLGDALVDEYYKVKVNRISPEFPMPIMWSLTDDPQRKPGGAANVAYQFKNFNVDVTLDCLPDLDAASVFVDHGINYHTPMIQIQSKLPVKRRFFDDNVQIIRHDIESRLCGVTAEIIDFYTDSLCQEIGKRKVQPNVTIFSDYNKGFFNSEECNLLDLYNSSITIVDPKKGPIKKWRGCTIFKPNAKEAEDLSGRTKWKEQAKYFQNELECESVVITDGGKKVSGVYKEEFFCFVPDKVVEVESVIGAGDTFCVFLALAVGHGFTIPEAAEIAWTAGSVYVQNNMNRPITPAELAKDKIVSPEDLANRDYKLVFTNGCFDAGLTVAHVKCLEFAKQHGDKLVVAMNSDASVTRIKGNGRPILSFLERSQIVSALGCVDFIVEFNEDTPKKVIDQIRPSVIVKGGDYKKEDVVGKEIAEIKIFPYIEATSTTEKIRRCNETSRNLSD